MNQREPTSDAAEPAVEDQYISVLLEYYCAVQEAQGPSRLDQTKVAYWKGVVAFFEKERLGRFRRQLDRQVAKTEKLPLGPVGLALLRYAWGAYLIDGENGPEVEARWRRYFSNESAEPGIPGGSQRLVSFEEFRRRRIFEEARRGSRVSGLWPWG